MTQHPSKTAQREALDLISCKGLVVGIAKQQSLAWSAAEHFHNAGAELAISYLNDKVRPFVEPLAQELSAPLRRTGTLARSGAPRWSSPATTPPPLPGRFSMSMRGSTSKAWFLTEALEGEGARTMTVTDPVCGMQVDLDKAAAREEHGGWAYFFCSAQCHRRFREGPEGYVRRAREAAVSSAAETERGDHE